jgi:hypothetical protein
VGLNLCKDTQKVKKDEFSAASASLRPAHLWATSDLDLAAYLVLEGCPLHEIEPTTAASPRRYSLAVFKRSPELAERVARWNSEDGVLGNLREYSRIRRSVYRWAKSVEDVAGGR